MTTSTGNGFILHGSGHGQARWTLSTPSRPTLMSGTATVVVAVETMADGTQSFRRQTPLGRICSHLTRLDDEDIVERIGPLTMTFTSHRRSTRQHLKLRNAEFLGVRVPTHLLDIDATIGQEPTTATSVVRLNLGTRLTFTYQAHLILKDPQ